MILKPFMLRRTKKEVENELSEKIEVLLYCSLTEKQRALYKALKQKISVDDLVRGCCEQQNGSVTSQADPGLTASLMNLVMQFRKVSPNPDLVHLLHCSFFFFLTSFSFILYFFYIYSSALYFSFLLFVGFLLFYLLSL
jgi:DNA helicase INO80